MNDKVDHQRRRFLGGSAGAAAVAGMAATVPLLPVPTLAQSQTPTRVRPAPQWDILEWINGDGGNVDKLRGKVIIIDFFQLWCPGCNKFSGPLMKYWQQKFARDVDQGTLKFIKIHTVFEGHNYQTVKRLKNYIRDKGITIPVGVDRHRGERRVPETMVRYKTRGTPEMVMIDKDGMIRFQQFGYFEPHKIEPLILAMLNRKRV